MKSLRTAFAVALVSFGFATPAFSQSGIPPVSVQAPFEGYFHLYADPGHIPSPFCDTGTSLVLDTGKISGRFAVLEEFVAGRCTLYVAPETRFVTLAQTGESCGSKYYVGTFFAEDGRRDIEITDHRNRTCRDLVPAKIIVKETYRGTERTIYSSEVAVSPR